MSLVLLKEGIFTSLQNLAGSGSERFGINPCGPMDRFAARVANILVGNDENAAVLEMHFPAPQIEFEATCRFALSGADFSPSMNGVAVRNWSCHLAVPGDVLRFEQRVRGSRSYLTIEGGIRDFGTATGFATEKLTRKARLEFRTIDAADGIRKHGFVSQTILPPYSGFPTVRMIPCGEFDRLTDDSKNKLKSSSFTLSSESNRMGFRLQGPSLELFKHEELVSAAVTFGTVQLLPDGQVIVLMADHQTSGGYPRIANVISADLPVLGQLGPGDRVSFAITNIEQAEQAALQVEHDLRKLRTGVEFGRYR